MKARSTLALGLIIVIILAMAGCAKKPPLVVNGQAVSQAEFEAETKAAVKYYQSQLGTDPTQDPEMKQQLMKDVMNNLVIKMVIKQEATRRGYKVTDKEVIDAEKQFITDLGGQEMLNKLLKQQGETRQSLRTQLREQLLMEKLQDEVTKNITVSEKEARNYYDKNKEKFSVKRELKVAHILVKTEKEAKDIIKQLEAGADFTALAKNYSTDETTKQNGGDLGWVNEDTQFEYSFLEATMALKPGQFTKTPVATDYGWHIIKVSDEKPPSEPTYDQVKLKAMAEAQKSKKDQAWIKFVETAKKKAKVETNL
ncbi:MAG: peptidylprolyl isomerase [Candidatus Saccharibacteria bacterium]